jgi:hypothetical protein
MKRTSLVVVCLCILAVPAAFSQGISLGAGAFGGMDFPLLQDDNTSGAIYGVRGIVKLNMPITLEPFLYFGSYGAGEFTEFTNDLDGAEITAYGVDATLFKIKGKGMGPYFLVGAGFYDIADDAVQNAYESQGTRIGYSAGAGLAIGLTPYLMIDIRGKGTIVTQDGGGSRKSAGATAGLSYFFGMN